MEIRRIGKHALWIKGKKENIFVNPTEDNLKLKKYQPTRIIIVTGSEHDNFGLGNDEVILRGPGEYEVGGVEMLGVNGAEDYFYVINIDGVKVGLMGDMKDVLSDKKIEKINALDVLVIPIKSNDKVGTKIKMEWAKKWGANYVIPVGYEDSDEEFKTFLDDVDREDAEKAESLKVEKVEELPEGMEVVILKIQ
jgi:L-ascorbate metabolism protein UlaG (beta-lactamase superfamily)